MKSNRVRSADEVRKDFERKGITVMSFARQHGLNPGTVYQVLSGEKKGRRGEAHRAAVLLGLKDGIVDQGVDA